MAYDLSKSIIHQLDGLFLSERTATIPGTVVFTGSVTLAAATLGTDITLGSGVDINTNVTTGTKLATTALQKLGFWGATPVVQPVNIADLAAITGGESPTEAEHNLIVTKVNAILTALESIGILAAS